MENENKRTKCYALCTKVNPIPQRYIHALMGCLAIVNAYLMRQCLVVTITQIVLPRNYTKADLENEAHCKSDVDFLPSEAHQGTLDWDQKRQSLCLSAFYIGYLITHLPGGYLADNLGSKYVLMYGILMSAIFTLLTPLAIELWGAQGLMVLRIMMGFSQGTSYPALAVLVADWIPKRERGLLGSIVLGGGQIGSMLSYSMSAWMLEKYHWHVVFYVWAVVGLLWCVLFTIFCNSSPLKHPCIGIKEKQYLLIELGDMSARREELPPPQVKAMLSSSPMWNLISAQVGHDWAYYIIVTYLPKYMNDVLQMKMQKNSLISSLPSLCMWISSIIFGFIADILLNTGLMKTTPVRKLMTGLASFGPAIFLIAASYSGCDRVAVIINFCVCLAIMGAYYAGVGLTPIDMSTNYAGMVMAISDGAGSAMGFLAPYLVGWMTPNTSMQEWRIVFWVAVVVISISGVVFCIWADSELQPWNEPEEIEED